MNDPDQMYWTGIIWLSGFVGGISLFALLLLIGLKRQWIAITERVCPDHRKGFGQIETGAGDPRSARPDPPLGSEAPHAFDTPRRF